MFHGIPFYCQEVCRRYLGLNKPEPTTCQRFRVSEKGRKQKQAASTTDGYLSGRVNLSFSAWLTDPSRPADRPTDYGRRKVIHESSLLRIMMWITLKFKKNLKTLSSVRRNTSNTAHHTLEPNPPRISLCSVAVSYIEYYDIDVT